MLILLSPAKSLNFSQTENKTHHIPRLLSESEKLIKTLRNKPQKEIRKLMSISQELAKLNATRYQTFHTPFNLENAKQAILAFDGDVYTGLEASTLSNQKLTYANEHIRILSGLYGLLKPMDLIQPYRLEMGTRLKTRRGTNLYHFWKNQITELLNQDIQDYQYEYVINLASNEYFKAIKKDLVKVPIIDFDFLENRDGEYKFISFTAKKARGQMARFIIDHKIKQPGDLKAFDVDNYIYNESLSLANKFVFVKE